MRIRILRFFLFVVFLPVVIFRHAFRWKKVLHLDSNAIEKRLSRPRAQKRKPHKPIDTRELDELLNREISTENIL